MPPIYAFDFCNEIKFLLFPVCQCLLVLWSCSRCLVRCGGAEEGSCHGAGCSPSSLFVPTMASRRGSASPSIKQPSPRSLPHIDPHQNPSVRTHPQPLKCWEQPGEQRGAEHPPSTPGSAASGLLLPRPSRHSAQPHPAGGIGIASSRGRRHVPAWAACPGAGL